MPSELITTDAGNGKQLPSGANARTQAIAKAEKIRCLFLAAREARRDMQQIEVDIKRACQNASLAERACYEYRKGGQLITGPSIDLMTEIARIYGLIYSGWEVTDQNMEEGWTEVYAEAIDLQTLAVDYRSIRVPHGFMVSDKKSGTSTFKKLTDPRDIKDWIANISQRQKRTCIEQIIPQYLIDDAVKQVEETLKHADTAPLTQRAQNMLKKFFENYGVNEAQIEKVLGNKIAAVTENQIARMAKIYNTLRDGAAKVEDYFAPDIPVADIKEPPAKEQKAEGAEQQPAKQKGSKKGAKSAGDQASTQVSTPESTNASPKTGTGVASDQGNITASAAGQQSSDAQSNANAMTNPPEAETVVDVDWSQEFGG